MPLMRRKTRGGWQSTVPMPHDNVIIRALMWKKLKMGSLIKTKLFWLYEIEVVVGIFIICLLIDIIRRELIEEKIIKSIRKNSV